MVSFFRVLGTNSIESIEILDVVTHDGSIDGSSIDDSSIDGSSIDGSSLDSSQFVCVVVQCMGDFRRKFDCGRPRLACNLQIIPYPLEIGSDSLSLGCKGSRIHVLLLVQAVPQKICKFRDNSLNVWVS